MNNQLLWGSLQKHKKVETLKPASNTLVLFCYGMQFFLCGAEVSACYTTSWRYINEMVKPNNSRLVFSTLTSSYYLPVIFLNSFTRHWCSKTKNLGRVLLISNVTVLVGSLMYALPYSSLCVVFGKIFQGFALISQSAIMSERDGSLRTARQTLVLEMIYHTSFVLTPCIFLSFVDRDVKIGMLQLSYGNFAGVYIFLLSLINLLITIVAITTSSKPEKLASLSSKKYGKFYMNATLKKYQSFQEKNTTKKQVVVEHYFKTQLNWVEMVNKMRRNGDKRLELVLFNASANLPQATTLYILPLLYLEVIKAEKYFVNISVAGISAVPVFFILLIVSGKMLSLKTTYFLLWATLILLLATSVFLLLLLFFGNAEYLKVISLVVITLALSLLRVVNYLLTPANILQDTSRQGKQVFHKRVSIGNVHSLMLNTSNMAGGILAGCVYKYMQWFYSAVVLGTVVVMLYLYRSSKSKYPAADGSGGNWYDFQHSPYTMFVPNVTVRPFERHSVSSF